MNFKLNFLLLVFAAFIVASCSKELSNNELENASKIEISLDAAENMENYGDAAVEERGRKSAPTFNTLNAALACTGLDAALTSGTFTVYAPTDAAFMAAGLTVENICAVDSDVLTSILLYHVAGYDADPGVIGCVTLLDGNIAQLSKVKSKRFINAAERKIGWVQAGKGSKLRVYAINSVLTPPTATIAEVASEADDFSILFAAVLAADPGIAAALSDESQVFTVFAPTNQAFVDLLGDLGLNSLDEVIGAIGVDGLSTILLYHVVNACAFSNDLVDGQKIPTLQGETITVDLENLSILDKSGMPAGLDATGLDILTSNGVIHTINKVLLPQEILTLLGL